MSSYSNVTEQDLINLRKLAEQQKSQRALKIKKRTLKQTQNIKLAGSLSPITKKLDENNETNKQLGELVKKSDVEDGITQTPALKNIGGTQFLRDTSPFIKKSKNFSKLEEKDNFNVFWNKFRIKPSRDNAFSIKDEEYDINPTIQAYFANTKLTTKHMDNQDKSTL